MAFRNIQGLRAVAVCLVLVAHVYGIFDRVVARSLVFDALTALGHAGVDLFFVISGFIMICVHWSNFGDRHITRTFLIRRIVRIVPLYWLVTLALALLFAIAPRLAQTWPQSNVVLSLLIVPMHGQPLLFVGWTLVYEMYFYYVFAALLNLSRTRAAVGLGLWAAIIALAQLWPGRASTPLGQQYLGTLVLEFLFGVAVGWLVMRRIFRFAIPSIVIGTLAIASSVCYVVAAHVAYADDWSTRFLFYGLPMALILYGFVGLECADRYVMPPAIRRIGDASYSIYLWHTVLYAMFGHLLAIILRYVRVPWPVLVCVPILTLLVSMLLYERLEKPLLRKSRDIAARLTGRQSVFRR